MTKLASIFGRGAVTVLVVGLCACRGGDTSRESAPAGTGSSGSLAQAMKDKMKPPPPLPGDQDPAPAAPAPTPGRPGLLQQLEQEASSRPDGAIRSEALVDAVKAKGVKVARTTQVLARTLKARYCAIAVTDDGLVASVCEFGSAADAAAAAKESEQQFGKILPNRRFVTNGKSLLTLANLRDTVEAEAKTVAATFAALSAT